MQSYHGPVVFRVGAIKSKTSLFEFGTPSVLSFFSANSAVLDGALYAFVSSGNEWKFSTNHMVGKRINVNRK